MATFLGLDTESWLVVATLGLAAVTGSLAWLQWVAVRTASKPVLSNVPPQAHVGHDRFRVEDEQFVVDRNDPVHMEFSRGQGGPYVLRSVLLRNVGNGAARIVSVKLTDSWGERPSVSGGISASIIRPNELVRVFAHKYLGASPDQVNPMNFYIFSAEVWYEDIKGQQLTRMEIRVFRGKGTGNQFITWIAFSGGGWERFRQHQRALRYRFARAIRSLPGVRHLLGALSRIPVIQRMLGAYRLRRHERRRRMSGSGPPPL